MFARADHARALRGRRAIPAQHVVEATQREAALRLLPVLILGLTLSPARAETPQEFASRLRALDKSLTVSVNWRDDKTTFGSLSIGMPPRLLEDRDVVGKVLDEVGRYAKDERMRITVVARKPDGEAFVAKLKGSGAPAVSVQVMSDAASNQTARLFVLPGGLERK